MGDFSKMGQIVGRGQNLFAKLCVDIYITLPKTIDDEMVGFVGAHAEWFTSKPSTTLTKVQFVIISLKHHSHIKRNWMMKRSFFYSSIVLFLVSITFIMVRIDIKKSKEIEKRKFGLFGWLIEIEDNKDIKVEIEVFT